MNEFNKAFWKRFAKARIGWTEKLQPLVDASLVCEKLIMKDVEFKPIITKELLIPLSKEL
jgi:hypothetical protein